MSGHDASIEGRLAVAFVIFPRGPKGDGPPIECRFGPNVPLGDIRAALGKRVIVDGKVHERGWDRVSVDVETLSVFPDPPRPEDVLCEEL